MNGPLNLSQTPAIQDSFPPSSQVHHERAQNPKDDNKLTFRLRQDGNENEELYLIAGLSIN